MRQCRWFLTLDLSKYANKADFQRSGACSRKDGICATCQMNSTWSGMRPRRATAKNPRRCLITVADDHPDKVVAYNAMQDVPGFVAGKSYRVSAKVRTQGLRNMPFICAQCLDSSKSKFVGFAGTPKRALQADIQEWERIETTVLVPEGTATFRLRSWRRLRRQRRRNCHD